MLIQAFASTLFFHDILPQKTTGIKEDSLGKDNESTRKNHKDVFADISVEGRELLKSSVEYKKVEAKTTSNKPENELSKEEKQQVDDLKKRDAEVRAHEQAHLRAAGKYAASGTKFEYQTGPDGNRYAVGGHVDIDTSEIPNDPEATIEKAKVIIKAANAPANPSPKDRQIAASASQMEAKARAEKINQNDDTHTIISNLPPVMASNPYSGAGDSLTFGTMNLLI